MDNVKYKLTNVQFHLKQNKDHPAYSENEEKKQRLNDILYDLQIMYYKCIEELKNGVISRVQQSDGISVSSVTNLFLYDSNYRRIYEIYRLLHQALTYMNVSKDEFPFKTREINNLYEQWVLIQVKLALQNIGFVLDKDFVRESWTELIGQDEPNSAKFYSLNKEYRLLIIYEKVYPFFYKRKDEKFGIETRPSRQWSKIIDYIASSSSQEKKLRSKRCPDISIEIYDINSNSEIPLGIITCDSHFSSESNHEKFVYIDNIVSFAENDLEDIQKSKRLVWASFDIFLGQPNQRDKIPDPLMGKCYKIPLYPSYNSTKNLEIALKEVLVKNEVLRG